MSKAADEMLIQAVVLLERQHLLSEHAIKIGNDSLKSFEDATNSGSQSLGNVLEVYNYCFSLIDHLVRYQKIAFSIPKLNQKTLEFRALDHAMDNLKDIRNQLQHLNNDIQNNFKGPLLGTVCWASGLRQYMASFHDLGRTRSSPGLVFDTQSNVYIHKFCYIYNETYYDLGKAVAGMRKFTAYIKSVVRIQVDEKAYNPEEHFIAACFEIKKT